MLILIKIFKFFFSHKFLKDIDSNVQIVNRKKKHLTKVRLFKVKKKFKVYYHLRQKFFFQKLHMFFVKKKKKWHFLDFFVFKSNKLKMKVLNYGLSLKLRQLLKYIYRCNENAFKRYITNKTCNFSNRLDLVCLRSTFCSTLRFARFCIHRGFIQVNGFVITYCNFYLKKYDFIVFKKVQDLSENDLKRKANHLCKKELPRHCSVFFYKFRLRNVIMLFSKIQYVFIYFFYKFFRLNLILNSFNFFLISVNYFINNMFFLIIFSIKFIKSLFLLFFFNLKKYKTFFLYNNKDFLLSFKKKNSLNYFIYLNNLILKLNFMFLLFTVNKFKFIMFSSNKSLKNACFGLLGFFKFKMIILFLFKSLRFYYRSYFYYYYFFYGLMCLTIYNVRIYFIFLYFLKKTILRFSRNVYMFLKKRIKRCLRTSLYLRKRIYVMLIAIYFNYLKKHFKCKFFSYIFLKVTLFSIILFKFKFFTLNYGSFLFNTLSKNVKFNKFLVFGSFLFRTFYSVVGYKSKIKSNKNCVILDISLDLNFYFFLRKDFFKYFLQYFSNLFFKFIDLGLIDIDNFFLFNVDLNLLLFNLFIKESFVFNQFFFYGDISIFLFLFNLDILFSFFFFNLYSCDILSNYQNFEYFNVKSCNNFFDIKNLNLNYKQFKCFVDFNFINKSFNDIIDIFKKFICELNLFCLFLEKKINQLTVIDLFFLLFNHLKVLFLKYKIMFLFVTDCDFSFKIFENNFGNFSSFFYTNILLYYKNIILLKNNYKYNYNFKLLNKSSLVILNNYDFNFFFFLKKLRYNCENILKNIFFNIIYMYSFFYYILKIFNIFFFNFFYIVDFGCILYCNLNLIYFFFNFIYIFYIFYLYFLFIYNFIDIFCVYFFFYLIFFKLNNFFLFFLYFKQFNNKISIFISNWFFDIIYFFFFNKNILLNLIYCSFLIKWNIKRIRKRILPLLYHCFFSVNCRTFQRNFQNYRFYLLNKRQYVFKNIVNNLFIDYMWWFYVKYYVHKPLNGLSVDNLIYWKFMRLKYLNFYFSKSFIYRDIEIQHLSCTFIYIGSTNSFIQNLKNNYNFFFMLILRFYKYRKSSLN